MPGPEIISSSFFGVGTFEAWRLPIEEKANGIILNNVFYPYQMKYFTKSTAGGLGYMITVEPGKAYYIKEFWSVILCALVNPVIVYSFYDYVDSFKKLWYITYLPTPSTFTQTRYKVGMMMPSTMQFTQTLSDEGVTVGFMEVDLYCAVVPSLIQVDNANIKTVETDEKKECKLFDWIGDKCVPDSI